MVTPNHYGIIAQASDPVKLPAGLEIRRAGPEDRAVLEQMSDIIARHQALAPAWVATDSTTLGELREGFAELAADPDVTVWLAFQNGEAVGYQAFFEAPPAADDLITPERCGELKVAGTVPSARGIGVGSALTRHGLAHERTKGLEVCLTDWHVPNLTSSRFWPKWGFVPVVQRLRRRVDERALGSEV